jgi:L-methionine (R)-S-oxide reductase
VRDDSYHIAGGQRIANVHEFPGHIACDSASNSELVIPLLDEHSGSVLGVFDLDCGQLDGFDAEDQDGLERIVAVLRATKWS